MLTCHHSSRESPSAAIPDIKRSLGASDSDISLSLSLFIVVQGTTPLLWSAISEIKGRKVRRRLIFALGHSPHYLSDDSLDSTCTSFLF